MTIYFLDDADMKNYAEITKLKWLVELYAWYCEQRQPLSVGVSLSGKQWKSLQRAIKKSDKAKEWQKFSQAVDQMRIFD